MQARKDAARLLWIVLAAGACGPAEEAPAPEPDVVVGTAMKYDVAFSFYTLAGAHSYGTAYRDRYDAFWSRFGPLVPAEMQPALEGLRRLRDEQGLLYGSMLARLFAAVEGDGVSDLATALETDAPAVAAEVRSWGPDAEAAWNAQHKAGFVALLRWMEAAGFEPWWRAEIRPALCSKVAELDAAGLADIPIKAEVERWSRKPARAGRISVFPVYFMLHQGQQILAPDRPGLVYLAHSDWPASDFALQLVHEVAHNQLLDWSAAEVLATLDALDDDAWFTNVFEGQKVTSGYLSLQSFVEENVTEGAQMLMAQRLGVLVDPKNYLRAHDGGSHVLSAALLQLMAEKGWEPGAEPFQGFFLRMVADGELGPGRIQALRDRFFQP